MCGWRSVGLWSRLDLNDDYGVALAATLAKQTDKAPAQYQFKHLSFQEGLYAEHLLLLVTSLTPPNGNGWPGWATDKTASEFLNNRYMNNTCRIAAGHLGALLAKQQLGQLPAGWNGFAVPLIKACGCVALPGGLAGAAAVSAASTAAAADGRRPSCASAASSPAAASSSPAQSPWETRSSSVKSVSGVFSSSASPSTSCPRPASPPSTSRGRRLRS